MTWIDDPWHEDDAEGVGFDNYEELEEEAAEQSAAFCFYANAENPTPEEIYASREEGIRALSYMRKRFNPQVVNICLEALILERPAEDLADRYGLTKRMVKHTLTCVMAEVRHNHNLIRHGNAYQAIRTFKRENWRVLHKAMSTLLIPNTPEYWQHSFLRGWVVHRCVDQCYAACPDATVEECWMEIQPWSQRVNIDWEKARVEFEAAWIKRTERYPGLDY